MNLRLIVTILVIAAAPVCAQAQKPTPAKVTKADAQKVLKIISSDKAKTESIAKWPSSVTRWSKLTRREMPRNSMRYFQKMYQLGKQLGPEMPQS